jgi:hypothetical protein
LEYYNNILSITHADLTNGILSKDNCSKLAQRNKIRVVRRGCYGTPALIEFDSLPTKIKEAVILKYGNPPEKNNFTLRAMVNTDANAVEFYSCFQLPDGRNLPYDKQKKYVNNASILNAVINMVNTRTATRKSHQGTTQGIWQDIAISVSKLQDTHPHSLPENHRRLKNKADEYQANGYGILISGKWQNKNSAKVAELDQQALMRQLLRIGNNFDNEQIKMLYNIVADRSGWDKIIDGATVGNYRKKWELVTHSGRKGVASFENEKAMIIKRRAPVNPMVYWTMDGWDVELLYQNTEVDKNGHSRTTYHNRLTVVIVLDPCCKYPVGYAIGTHETPELIKAALRNAINHTRELFGNRYKVLQLQTDNYGRGNLTPFYEACTDKYTPARAHNAKSKVIEPYFNAINKKYFQLMPNWSGHGVASGSKNQPNSEYLNKIRTSFPDATGCRIQIERVIEMERTAKQAEYVRLFGELPTEDKIKMSDSDFLFMLGDTKDKTNKLSAGGFLPTIMGVKREYDCFDPKFRELAFVDWTVKYDPQDTSEILVCNDDGSQRFILNEKYVQPMALYERTENDIPQLQKVRGFNSSMKESITEGMGSDYRLVESMFNQNPELEGTLTKLIICDSNGQHKDNRNAKRLAPAKKLLEKQNAKEVKEVEKNWKQTQDEYLKSKVNLEEYL